VGATDLAVEKVRDLFDDVQERFATVQKDVNARVADVSKTEPKVYRDKAVKAFNERVEAVQKDVEARRKAVEARVAELQTEAKGYPAKVQNLVDDNVASANSAYADLVKRGESLVKRIRNQQSTKDAV